MERKTITLDDAFELTEDFRSNRAVERFLEEVVGGGYDKFIDTVEDLKAAIAKGEGISFIESSHWKVKDYCFDKINGEEWEVVEEWLGSEGYEMNDDCETYTKA